MKIARIKQLFIPAGFALMAFSNQQGFVLTTIENNHAGYGTFETSNNSVVTAKIMLEGYMLTGTGELSDNLYWLIEKKKKQGMSYGKAYLNSLIKDRRKEANILLTGTEEKSLQCKFQVAHQSLSGYCIDPNNQQKFLIKTSADNAS